MCIRVLTIFKCACPHRNTLVCPHHVHVDEPSSTTSSNLSSKPSSRPTTSSSSSDTPSPSPTDSPSPSSETPLPSPPPSASPESTEDDSDFQKGFTPRLPSALQGHKLWTPLPGKENQRWEHCPGYLAKSRALLATTTTTNGKTSGDVTTVGKETQCAEYKATDPKFRRRWEVKAGLCEECKGVHGMDGPSEEQKKIAAAEKEARIGMRTGIPLGKVMIGRGTGKGVVKEERGRARSRAVTDPTPTPKVGAVKASVPRSGQAGEGNVVKGLSGKAVGKRVVRKRIATL